MSQEGDKQSSSPEAKKNAAAEATAAENSQKQKEQLEATAEAGREEEKKIAEEAGDLGATVYSFDPDASPEKKTELARQLAKSESLPDAPNLLSDSTAKALITDSDLKPMNPPDLPTSIRHVRRASSQLLTPSAPAQQSNWRGLRKYLWHSQNTVAQTGWEQVGGTGSFKEWLENTLILSEDAGNFVFKRFFGNSFLQTWWSDAVAASLACVGSYLLGRYNYTSFLVPFVIFLCFTFYRRGAQRLRYIARDDAYRAVALRKLDEGHESLEWLNAVLAKFWVIYEPLLSSQIVAEIDTALDDYCPPFLESMRLSSFTLGTKAPRIESVKTYPHIGQGEIVYDWHLSFTPTDDIDVRRSKAITMVNPKIILQVKVGRGFASAGIPVLVKDFSFAGRLRVKITLGNFFPHIKAVEFSFLEPPKFDYVLKTLGGDRFGVDMASIPGLASFIREQVHSNLGPLMYAPNFFYVDVEQAIMNGGIDASTGLLIVTIYNARNLVNLKKKQGRPDSYVQLALGSGEPLASTAVRYSSRNPRWRETKYLMIKTLSQSLRIDVYDYNGGRSDNLLGSVMVSLYDLEEGILTERNDLPIYYGGKFAGSINFSLQYNPVQLPKTLSDGSVQVPSAESEIGIARLMLTEIKDLERKDNHRIKRICIRMLVNGNEVSTLREKKYSSLMQVKRAFECLVFERSNCRIGLRIRNGGEKGEIIGSWQSTLEGILDTQDLYDGWYDLSNVQKGRFCIKFLWKPVNLKTGSLGQPIYKVPIGVMRFHVKKATDLRNVEKFGRHSDPFVRISSSFAPTGSKTTVVWNNLNPVWDEVLYVPVRKVNEKFLLEVFDWQDDNKHRSLGYTEIKPTDVLNENEEDLPVIISALEDLEKLLRSRDKKRGPEGTLIYNASFFPCLNVTDEQNYEEKEVSPSPKNKKSNEKGRKASAELSQASQNSTSPQQVLHEFSTIKNIPFGEPLSRVATTESVAESVIGPDVFDELDNRYPVGPTKLVSFNSGLVIFKILKGELCRPNLHLETYFDDSVQPAYVTNRSRSKVFHWNEIGDCFIKDLQHSKIILKLVRQPWAVTEGVAQASANLFELMKESLNSPSNIKLVTPDGEENSVTLSFKWIPMLIDLPEFERFENQGKLTLTIESGTSFPAADKNGKSDPFIVVLLDGERIYKSKICKKTLNPIFNESTSFEVPSRCECSLQLKAFDWDFGNKAEYLDTGVVNLMDATPNEEVPQIVRLQKSHGEVKIKLFFKPEWIVRAKKRGLRSLGSGVLNTAQGVASIPIKGAGLVGGAAITGVGGAAKIAGRGFGGAGKLIGMFGRKLVGSQRAKDVLTASEIRDRNLNPDDKIKIDLQELALERSEHGGVADISSAYQLVKDEDGDSDSSTSAKKGPLNDRASQESGASTSDSIHDKALAKEKQTGKDSAKDRSVLRSSRLQTLKSDYRGYANPVNGFLTIEIVRGDGFPRKFKISVETSGRKLCERKISVPSKGDWNDTFTVVAATNEQILFKVQDKSFKKKSGNDTAQANFAVNDHLDDSEGFNLEFDAEAELFLKTSFEVDSSTVGK